MTTYEPGRIYSGVVRGKRKNLFRRNCTFADEIEFFTPSQVTHIRGPLVVLDPDDLPLSPLAAIESLRASGSKTTRWIADQIEEQTRPPLEIGWHEVEELNSPRWFDGSRWRSWPHENAPGWLPAQFNSTHFIGRGSGDE